MGMLVAGHTCVDFLPRFDTEPGFEPGRLYEVGPAAIHPGGTVPNTGSALRRLGVAVRAQTTVGRDPFGDLCEAWLTEHVGDDVTLHHSDRGTSYTIVVETSGRDRTFWHSVGANHDFRCDFDLAGIECVHVGYPALVPSLWPEDGRALRDAFAHARSLGVTTSLDLACVPPHSAAAEVDWAAWFANVLPQVDVLSPSWDDLACCLGLAAEPCRDTMTAAVDMLIEQGVGVAILSAGQHGFVVGAAEEGRLRAGGVLLRGLPAGWAGVRDWSEADHFEHIVTATGAGDHLTAAALDALGRGFSPTATAGHIKQVVAHHLQGLPLGDLAREVGP